MWGNKSVGLTVVNEGTIKQVRRLYRVLKLSI